MRAAAAPRARYWPHDQQTDTIPLPCQKNSAMTKPAFYSPELASEVCDRLALGRSLRSVCEDEDMPSRESVRRWLKEREDFRTHYNSATSERADALFEDMLAIADDRSIDWQDRKVMIATRQWAMARMAPKKYGARVEVSSDSEKPLAPEMSDLERARVIAFVLAKAGVELERRNREQASS